MIASLRWEVGIGAVRGHAIRMESDRRRVERRRDLNADLDHGHEHHPRPPGASVIRNGANHKHKGGGGQGMVRNQGACLPNQARKKQRVCHAFAARWSKVLSPRRQGPRKHVDLPRAACFRGPSSETQRSSLSGPRKHGTRALLLPCLLPKAHLQSSVSVDFGSCLGERGVTRPACQYQRRLFPAEPTKCQEEATGSPGAEDRQPRSLRK
jgi:hypothetical protein